MSRHGGESLGEVGGKALTNPLLYTGNLDPHIYRPDCVKGTFHVSFRLELRPLRPLQLQTYVSLDKSQICSEMLEGES